MAEKITDAKLRKLVGIPGETQKIAIGAGLALWITVNQSGKTARTWYLRYYDDAGKQQRSKLGEYPDVSLAQAQAQAENAKKAAKEGVRLADVEREKRKKADEKDPADQVHTFESISKMWMSIKKWSPENRTRQEQRMENLCKALGSKPVNGITMLDVVGAIAPYVEKDSRETAKRATDMVRNVIEHANTLELLKPENAGIIEKIRKYRADLPRPKKKKLFRPMSEYEIGRLLFLIHESRFRGTLQVSIALRLAPYVMLRPANICEALWSEIDLEAKLWRIPAGKMKMEIEHVVPLPCQAMELLTEIHGLTGGQQYIFPSWTKRKKGQETITTNALIGRLRKLGFKSTLHDEGVFVTHGFRGLASTALNQNTRFHKYRPDWIEHQLAHEEEDEVRDSYNVLGTWSYLDERREMLQDYADYLDELRAIYAKRVSLT